MKHLFTIIFLSLLSCTLRAQPDYHRPPGMPEDTLVAFDDFKPAQETATLRTLLGIHSFRWMLQIPKDARTVLVTLSEFDTRTQQSKEIARFAFDPVPPNPSKRVDRPTFFPISLTLLPLDTKADDPWQTSRSFLGLLEVPDLNVAIRRSYPNPFRAYSGGLSIFNTTRIATALEQKPGMWDGFGKTFDIMARGERDQFILRVSFSASSELSAQ